jgi:sugar/nucleoside kinase (ribokinase family)
MSKNDEKDVDIAILGHIAKDIIEIDGISYPSIGGGVFYGGLTGIRMNLKMVIITRLRADDFLILEILRKEGIEVIAYPANETSGIHNIYSSQNMEFRSYKPLGFAGAFIESEIPDFRLRFFVIGSILAGEVNTDLLKFLSTRFKHKLCLDIQGFIRIRENDKIFYRKLEESLQSEILSQVDILKVDQTELNVLTDENDIEIGAFKLAQNFKNIKEILITHEKGISLLFQDTIYCYQWKNKSSIGRTGRGDTAFISYLGARISQDPKKALRFSAALTSLKMEAQGPFNYSIQDVENLIEKEYAHIE